MAGLTIDAIVEQAVLLLRAENVKLSRSTLTIFKRIKEEEITLGQARQMFFARVTSWRKRYPEWFYGEVEPGSRRDMLVRELRWSINSAFLRNGARMK